MIEVWNEFDRLDADARAALAQGQVMHEAAPLAISAATGEGIDRLLTAIEDRLARGRTEVELMLDAGDGAGLHWLYEHARDHGSAGRGGRRALKVRVAPDQVERVKKRFVAARAGAGQSRN